MTHDPLCVKTDDPYTMATCKCDLIAKAREDMLSKCIEAVTETPGIYMNLLNPNPPLRKFVDEMDVIAALRDLQDKP
jgi:hypothetical protein